MNILGIGSPVSVSPNFGPWMHFIWVVIIMAMIFGVLWWALHNLGIPAPFFMVLKVLLIVAMVICVILYVLVPLMGVF